MILRSYFIAYQLFYSETEDTLALKGFYVFNYRSLFKLTSEEILDLVEKEVRKCHTFQGGKFLITSMSRIS